MGETGCSDPSPQSSKEVERIQAISGLPCRFLSEMRNIQSLFESNDLTLGVNEIYEIGRGLIL